MAELYKGKTETVDRTPAQMREEVVFRAIESEATQRAVKESAGMADTLRRVRLVLDELFPEIKEIPREGVTPGENMVGSRMKSPLGFPTAEFLIAKDIITLLKED